MVPRGLLVQKEEYCGGLSLPLRGIFAGLRKPVQLKKSGEGDRLPTSWSPLASSAGGEGRRGEAGAEAM